MIRKAVVILAGLSGEKDNPGFYRLLISRKKEGDKHQKGCFILKGI
jgi:hypothetical protein